MLIDRRPDGYNRIDVGERDHDSDSAAHTLGGLRLIQIARCIVINGRPFDGAQIAYIASRRQARPWPQRLQLLLDLRRKIRMKPFVDHLLVGRGSQIKSIGEHAQKAYHVEGSRRGHCTPWAAISSARSPLGGCPRTNFSAEISCVRRSVSHGLAAHPME